MPEEPAIKELSATMRSGLNTFTAQLAKDEGDLMRAIGKVFAHTKERAEALIPQLERM